MPHFDEHLELHRLDCEASHGDLTSYNFTRERSLRSLRKPFVRRRWSAATI